MPFPIQNCGRLLKFRCPKSWGGLQATDDFNVRFCTSCQKQVYLCESPEDIERHKGDCIALNIKPSKRIELQELEEGYYLGESIG
ncbi:MAG: hypothetical protein K8T91_19130 [Planctomycetes bacterium]|nr:hypothetical protein [Planctomycetota bacterium]